jgi:hypothetical protein
MSAIYAMLVDAVGTCKLKHKDPLKTFPRLQYTWIYFHVPISV